MKKYYCFVLCFTALITIVGCNNNNVPALSKDEIPEAVDSLALQLHRLDSLINSGQLLHMDIYKLDKLKSVEFSVQSLDVGGEKYQYINLRKDCGGNYYYSWEDAKILPAECQYLMSAIETIKSNLHRVTDHEERYAYITKDDIRLFVQNDGGGSKWTIGLSVDYRKSNSEITLSEEDMEKFISLINSGLAKIKNISE